MSRSLFVVVSGPPGSGKSTLAPALARELGLPLVAKDTIKEALMSVLPVGDIEASREVGHAAVVAMLAVASESPVGAVVESTFHRSLATEGLGRLPGRVVEVFCRCDREVADARCRARAARRHPGHFDAARTSGDVWNAEVAEPVAGGWPVVEVDTTAPADVARVVESVRAVAGGPARAATTMTTRPSTASRRESAGIRVQDEGMAGGLRMRRGVRAVVLDDHARVLLVRFEFARPPDGVPELWATPGGGVEEGEDDRQALTRELAEEVGLHDPAIGPLIWTRTHVLPMSTGHDGQRERFYLVRTTSFEPRPVLTTAELRAENVAGLAWWSLDELAEAADVFAPRRLPELVAALVADGPPHDVVDVGV